MIDIDLLIGLFTSNNISTHKGSLHPQLVSEGFPDSLNEYLRIMTAPIRLNISPYGTAATYLMSQIEIVEEYRSAESLPIISNGYLLIGAGANGDPLCINIDTGEVVYVFHDALLEDSEEPFDDMLICLKMNLTDFLRMAFSGDDYPFDAHLAEKYTKD